MRLSKPKNITFILALILAVLALLGVVFAVPTLSTYAFWLMTAAFVILAAGVFFKDF